MIFSLVGVSCMTNFLSRLHMKLAGRIFQKEFWNWVDGSIVRVLAIQGWDLEFWYPEALQHWVAIAVCLCFQPWKVVSWVPRLNWLARLALPTKSGFNWETLLQWIRNRRIPDTNFSPAWDTDIQKSRSKQKWTKTAYTSMQIPHTHKTERAVKQAQRWMR